MKRTTKPEIVSRWLEKSNVRDCFSTPGLEFSVCEYDKGECITTPGKDMDEVLFVVKGTINVYGLGDEGALLPVNRQSAPTLLGDMEFTLHTGSPFFTEADSRVVCLSLPVKKYARRLNSDLKFLHTLLRSYREKLRLFALVDTPARKTEQRVLLYLEKISPAHNLEGINGAVLQLRCSRRQLQRVLSKLCAEGKVIKTGKGRYRLAGESDRKGI